MTIKSSFIGGIISLLLAFIAQIPILPQNNLYLYFEIFTLNDVRFYYWGYLTEAGGFTPILAPFPENIMGFFIWMGILYIGISSIMASTSKANIYNSLILFKINLILLTGITSILSLILILVLFQNILLIFTTAGLGYWLLWIILISNVLGYRTTKKKEQ
ncbi:MAG: membrane protein of unknown function [Promethearchaeota archaeon]|nr:MAG: membrane protein of unknown function [Candidatus Lokiarchaeota archaeon]